MRQSQAALDDLRRRLRATRWPEPAPPDEDAWAQGVPLAHLRDLTAYWADGYDWRATEDRINQIPQVKITVDRLDIHALHVHKGGGLPLLLTHGWPGSFFEYEAVLEPLTAAGFDVVVPSLPGYGFSGTPTEQGWGIHRIARAWADLMTALGYPRFIAAGSDWGTSISTSLAMQAPDRLLGIHLVPPLVAPIRTDLTPAEAKALEDLRKREGDGYSMVHATRPQTLGYSLVDSPAGLCAWIVEKIWTWSDHDGDLSAVLTDDQILDNITLYWLTGTAASSARLYRESIAEVSRWFTTETTDTVRVPTACTVFPKEVPRPSRRWAERRFPNIVHWGEPPRGGHFGAWEQPALFVEELKAWL
ncbi:epoxide hydrolase [Asanoa ishikariensis]|uniref:Pimeloyl-ACP methyl ester carboxylesterase n=1 Tax=Asanoa ishikariensis TaxID=137265 RepID=A0A1H3PCS1_9ACTN|nr:epoxide hydrolase family protein [Asanoa ishikariensis]GIF67907.1 epoxide hydrolase [Asanoa ishikariensis]SDY98926.1 Pimeloyl-ACP methyl ester carboxylesterase [Asanoa ishikariensis]